MHIPVHAFYLFKHIWEKWNALILCPIPPFCNQCTLIPQFVHKIGQSHVFYIYHFLAGKSPSTRSYKVYKYPCNLYVIYTQAHTKPMRLLAEENKRGEHTRRVGQNRTCTAYMTVYLVVFLPKIRMHAVYIWFWPTLVGISPQKHEAFATFEIKRRARTHLRTGSHFPSKSMKPTLFATFKI